MLSRILKVTALLFLMLFLAAGALAFHAVYGVYKETRDALRREVIEKVTASESPVFYDDGRTPIGVFFQQVHRRSLRYDEIPKVFIKALLAAEDKDFLLHRGIDIKGLLRAAWVNFRAGRVVQGGSTITQQTAKNIFSREARSFKSKFKEFLQAMVLEGMYSKEEILEMYVNQFFVTGFGKGLGVASQYFFDKDPKDLDLVEACFIAGSLKAPNRYNPFIKSTERDKSEARRLAKQRKDYVLNNMMGYNFITEQEYKKAKDLEVPFKEGRITYSLNVILDYVREQLESDYFKAVLAEKGIENIATSGIRIHTSVNKDIQAAALATLRKNLPLLDISLNGLKGTPSDVNNNVTLDIDKLTTESSNYLIVTVTELERQGLSGFIKVAWRGGEATLTRESLLPAASAWCLWRYGPGVSLDAKRMDVFLEQFKTGDQLVIEKTDAEPPAPAYLLTAVPSLDGSVVAMQKGMVRAMVGGFQNRHFNRAVHAKRQVGSIFKTLVYAAALQLKWGILDRLENKANLYSFQTTSYVPKPDHDPQSGVVSMAWAGAKSENLATVWLLYHLTDHLTPSEFYEAAKVAGLARQDGESTEAFRVRLRDRYGIAFRPGTSREVLLERAKEQIIPDAIFEGFSGVIGRLRELTLDDVTPPEEESQMGVRPGFETLRASNDAMKEALSGIRGESDEGQEIAGLFRTIERNADSKLYYFRSGTAPAGFKELIPVSRMWLKEKGGALDRDGCMIEGLMPSRIVDMLEEALARKGGQDDREALPRTRDFRTLVNMRYAVYLSRLMGIRSDLEAVLSFPLGPNAISLLETCLAYHTIMTGTIKTIDGIEELEMIPIITKIEDRNGEVIWEFTPREEQVLSRRVSCLTTEILRNVMAEGTGKKAKNAVTTMLEGSGGAPVTLPVFGKTGTANRFTNSSFVGYIPAPAEGNGDLSLDEGYVIATYVGYDDNRPMHSRHISIYGSTGALPLWVDTANAIAKAQWYRSRLKPADLAFGVPDVMGECLDELKETYVSPLSGLPVDREREPGGVKVYNNPERRFEPPPGSLK